MNAKKVLIFLLISLLSSSVFSSGAYMNLGDIDIEDEVDCSVEKNKDHEDCQEDEG